MPAQDSYFTGLLGGFNRRQQEVEAQNFAETQRQTAQEQKILSSLLASNDPEVQHLALTGLLDSAAPKKKKGGLRGWLGEVEQSPFLGQIQALIGGPAFKPSTKETLGATQSAGGVGLPAGAPSGVLPVVSASGEPSAAMPATSMVEQKGQPPAPTSYVQSSAPPRPFSLPPERRVFLDPMEKYRQEQLTKSSADVEGEIAGMVAGGFSKQEALDIYRKKVERQAGGIAGQTYAEGEITPDPTSPTGYSQTLYLRADPTKTFKQPAMSPLDKSTRQTSAAEMHAARLFGQPGEDPRAVFLRISGEPDGQAKIGQILAAVQKETANTAGATATATTMARAMAEAAAPLSRMDRLQATQSLRADWMKVAAPHVLVQNQMGVLNVAEAALRRGDRTAASEQIIVTFEKMLDALSVVRESEYLRPAYNQSLVDRITGTLSRMKSGGAPLSTEALQEYLRASREMGAATMKDYAQHRVAIERTARDATIDPANIFGDMQPGAGGPPPPSSAAPAPGGAPPLPSGTPNRATPAPGGGWTIQYP